MNCTLPQHSSGPCIVLFGGLLNDFSYPLFCLLGLPVPRGSGAVCTFPDNPALIKVASEVRKNNSRGAYDSISARIFSQALGPLSCMARNSPVEISKKAAPTVSPALQ